MSTSAQPLLAAGFALQREHRAELRSLPPLRRRELLEQRMLDLAWNLRAAHVGYAAHYRDTAELTAGTLPPLDKSVLAAGSAAFTGAAGVGVRAADDFLDRPFEIGSRFDEQRVLFSSSGSTGGRLLVPYHLTDLGRSLEAFVARAVHRDRPEATRVLYIGLTDRHNGGNAWMHHLGSVLRVRIEDLFAPVAQLLDAVSEFNPDVILTRPHRLLALGRLAARSGRALPPAHLLSVGDPLTAGAAEEIGEAWGSCPHNSYSTVETGPIGYQEDPAEPALTLYDDLHLVELLDGQGRPVLQPGQPGRIAVTTLYRCQFPLVRYLVGDTAAWRDEEYRRISFPSRNAVTEFDFGAVSAARPVRLHVQDLAASLPPGVLDAQLVQSARDTLRIRYTLTRQAADDPQGRAGQVDGRLCEAVRGLLQQGGLTSSADPVRITTQLVDVLEPDHRTGKVQRLVPLVTSPSGSVR